MVRPLLKNRSNLVVLLSALLLTLLNQPTPANALWGSIEYTYMEVPSSAPQFTKRDLQNLEVVIDGIWLFNEEYFNSGIYYWKKGLEVAGSPFCALHWQFENIQRVVLGLRYIRDTINLCQKVKGLSYFCRDLEPIEQWAGVIVNAEKKLKKKCDASQKIGHKFIEAVAWFDTLTWPIVMVVRPLLYAGHSATVGILLFIDFLDDYSNDRRHRHLSNSTLASSPAFDDLKLALKEDTTLSPKQKRVAKRLIHAHKPILSNMTIADFVGGASSTPFGDSSAHQRMLRFDPTSNNENIQSMTNNWKSFYASYQAMNETLMAPTLVDFYEAAQSIVDTRLRPLENSAAIRAISDFMDKHNTFFRTLDGVIEGLKDFMCPDPLRFVCDLDGMILDWLSDQFPQLSEWTTALLEDFVSDIGLDISLISNIADEMPDIGNIEFDFAVFKDPWEGFGDLFNAIEFDPFKGAFSFDGKLPDTSAFGGLELRMASSLRPDDLDIDCETESVNDDTAPLALQAWYRGLNCLEASDDFSPKILKPCGTDRKCDIDVWDYVSTSCKQTSTPRNKNWNNAINLLAEEGIDSGPSFGWYAVLYTCPTAPQLENINYMPKLTSTEKGEFRCSSQAEAVHPDDVAETDPCNDEEILPTSGKKFSETIQNYCRQPEDDRTKLDSPIPETKWKKGITFLRNVEDELKRLEKHLKNKEQYGYRKEACTVTNMDTFQCEKKEVFLTQEGEKFLADRFEADLKCVCAGGKQPFGSDPLPLKNDPACTHSPSDKCSDFFTMVNINGSHYNKKGVWNVMQLYEDEKVVHDARKVEYTTCANDAFHESDILKNNIGVPSCNGIRVNYACLEEGRDYSGSNYDEERTAIGFIKATDGLKDIEMSCEYPLAVIEVQDVEYGSGIYVTPKTINTQNLGCDVNQNYCTLEASTIPRPQSISHVVEAIRVNYKCYCGAGHYKDLRIDSQGYPECQAVPAGTYRTIYMDGPEECPIGTYSEEGADQCVDCDAGTYAPLEGSPKCFDCTSGTYSSARAGVCIPCPAHSIAPNKTASTCSPCLDGKEAGGEGNTVCVDVDIGHYSVIQTSRRQLMPAQKDEILTGSGPLSCSPGTFSNTTGASECDVCQPGYYAANSGSSSCDHCPFNTYSMGERSDSCKDCDPDEITAFPGQDNALSCFRPVLEFDYTDAMYSKLSCQTLLMLDILTTNETERSIILERRENQIRNGFCNGGPWNTPNCEYDGGDCCAGTCSIPSELLGTNDTKDVAWKLSCHPLTFACIDPKGLREGEELCSDTSVSKSPSFVTSTSASANDMPAEVPSGTTRRFLRSKLTVSTEAESKLERRKLSPVPGDGTCDDELNTEDNSWDGGDCCENTCNKRNVEGAEIGCSVKWDSNICLDPSQNDETAKLGNGRCDEVFNNIDNNWDNGDCCFQSCTELHDCFDLHDNNTCKNPYAKDITPPTLFSSTGSFDSIEIIIGNGWPENLTKPVVISTDTDPCFYGQTNFTEGIQFRCPLNSATASMTWTAIDTAGNKANETISFFLIDQTPPQLFGDEGFDDTIIYASDRPWSEQNVSSNDNDPCYNSSITFFQEEKFDCSATDDKPKHFLKRTWTVSDDSFNQASESRVLEIVDDVEPIISGKGFNIIDDRMPKEMLQPAGKVVATDEDRCTSDLTPQLNETYWPSQHACLAEEPKVIRTWTVKDRTGNNGTASMTITLFDDKKPNLTDDSYKHFTNAIDGEVFPLNTEYLINNIPEPANVSAYDNDPCFEGSYNVEYTQEPMEICATTPSVNRTWTVSDASNNTASVTVQFAVKDDQPPVFVGDFNNATIEAHMVALPNVNVSDDDPCFDSSSYFYEEVRINGSCANNYLLERSWEAMDSSGNVATKFVQLDVMDSSKPKVVPTKRICLRTEKTKRWISQDILNNKLYGFVNAQDYCSDANSEYCFQGVTATIGSCSSNHAMTSKDGRSSDCGEFVESGNIEMYIDSKDNGVGKKGKTHRLKTHRLYTLQVVMTDDCGNSSTSIIEFLVQNKHAMEASGSSKSSKSSKSDWDEWTLFGCDQYVDIEEDMMYKVQKPSSSKSSKKVK